MAYFSKPSDVKVGVIGYGGAFNMGKAHLTQMQRAGMKPFAVCEIDADRLKVAEEDFPGIETYDSLDKMLKHSDVNLLVHITPHNLHYKLAAKCLRAAKHVVTEKPFVLTTAEADKLIRLAEDNDVMVSTYHNRHWDGWIVRARREIVDKGVIGDVHRVELRNGGYGMPRQWWRSSKSVSGGVLYDWGVHLLEYALQLVPSDIVEVAGFHVCGYWSEKMPKKHPWKNDCNEDEAAAVVRFANGARIDLTATSIGANPERNYMLEAYGTKGSYLLNGKQWVTHTVNRQGKLVEKSGEHPRSGGGRIYYRNIADYLTGKADLIITPQWARRPIHILDLAGRSARKNKTLKAKYA
jgi:predicted dehydrogenase